MTDHISAGAANAVAVDSVAVRAREGGPLVPDRFERLLAVGAIIIFAAMSAAIMRGQAEWFRVPTLVWFHLATIAVALLLTPVMLLRRRGDRLHRQLGWIWSLSLFGTALGSLFIRIINHGQFSFIHLLSILTILQVPIIVWSARHHQIARHRRAVRGMVLGALLIAGFFTFPFNRLLGHWLFG